jgi:hypothetical protein
MSSNVKSLLGGAVFLAFAAFKVPNLQHEAWAHALLLFAALVLVPLALDLLAELNDAAPVARWFAGVRLAQFPAAVLLAAACWLPAGWVAVALALPWAGLTGMTAAVGVSRALRHGWARPLGRLSADVAMVFFAIGGLWVMADRAGLAPLGFAPAIVALTAVHFHYAGLLLPLFAGLAQRQMPDSRGVARVVVGVVLGVPAVAVGITTTQLGASPAIEAAAGMALALAGMAVAVLQVRLALEPDTPAGARAWLGVAGGALFFGMVLAGLYAIRGFAAPFPWLALPQMRLLHGTVNALGFGFCGVLGWRAAAR